MLDGEDKATLSTLTQRRAVTPNAGGGAAKLEKSKLKSISDYEEGEGGSAGKVVIWVVIIIVLAVAAYLVLRNYLKAPDNSTAQTTPTPTVTATPDPSQLVIAAESLQDSAAVDLPAAAAYKTATQTVGKTSEAVFTITKLLVQPYQTFTRLHFSITSDTPSQLFPVTTAEYDGTAKTITITFKNIHKDQSGLGYTKTATLTDSVIDTVTHNAASGNDEVYVVNLSAATGFDLHTVTVGTDNQVALDVKEIATPTVSVTATPTVTTTTSVTPTVSPTSSPSGIILQNDYSQSPQSIVTATTGNTVQITHYNFGDGSTVFTYNLLLGGTPTDQPYPNVTASLSGTTLTMVVSNLSNDAIVGNGGTGSTDFAAKGVRDINKVTIKNTNHQSTYTFDLDKAMNYRVSIDETDKVLRLELKH